MIKIKLLPTTDQQAFDMAYKGVMKQGKCSVNSYTGCVYYSGPGVACAIGHLATEEDRKRLNIFSEKSSLGLGALGLHRSGVIDIGGLSLNLLIELQHAHDRYNKMDGSEFKASYHKAMTSLSQDWDLKMPKLEDVYND